MMKADTNPEIARAMRILEERDEIRPGTDRVREALSRLGNPERTFPLIMVAGTNGKTSTAYFISQFLGMAGLKTGLFTSPHLEDRFRCMVCCGESISPAEYARLILRAADMEVYLTAFELEVAASLLFFAERQVDAAVMEMGMGGRDDAVFVRQPELAVITPISLEHTAFLGRTIEEIARNKGEIIPENGVLVTSASGKGFEVLEGIAEKRDTRVVMPEAALLKSTAPQLSASYLRENAALAAVAVREFLKIPAGKSHPRNDEILRWSRKLIPPPARFQTIDWGDKEGKIILDGAHNSAGFEVLFSEIADYLKRMENPDLTVVVGILRDKDIPEMAWKTRSVSGHYICTSPQGKRRAEPGRIAEEFEKYHNHVRTAETVEHGVEMALKGLKKGDVLLITGSLYTAAEALDYLRRRGIA